MPVGYSTTSAISIEIPVINKKLPLILDDFSLASQIHIRNKTLWYLITNTKRQYKKIEIPKKQGGKRPIHLPSPLMKHCQKNILRHILNPIQKTLKQHVTAYRKNISIKDTIEQHIPTCKVCNAAKKGHTPKRHDCPRAGTSIHIDLKEFFTTTSATWIRNYFKSLGYSHEVSRYLGTLMTIRDLPNPRYPNSNLKFLTRVPQGAPTSGAICNLVANHRLDTKILKLLKQDNNQWTYTRYADDMCFSCTKALSNKESNELIRKIYKTIQQSGYKPNKKKTRIVSGRKKKQTLGIVFNDKPNIDRKKVRKLRAIIHNCYVNGFETQLNKIGKKTQKDLILYLNGKVNWINQINPNKGAPLQKKLKEAIEMQIK